MTFYCNNCKAFAILVQKTPFLKWVFRTIFVMDILEISVSCKIGVKFMNAQCLENLYNKNRYLETNKIRHIILGG